MESYKSLTSLSKFLIFISWLIAILTIGIVSFYAFDGEDYRILISVLSMGVLIFIFLLSFGKLAQFLLDIRDYQLSFETSSIDNEKQDLQISYYRDKDKYKYLKYLAKFILVIGWLNLISAFLLIFYYLSIDEDFVDILPRFGSGVVLSVFLLTFGKVILLIFDIRNFQLDSPISPNRIEKNKTSIPSINDNLIDESEIQKLKYLIQKQKRRMFGDGYKLDIINTLNKLIDSELKANSVIYNYHKQFDQDLIKDLKSLTSNYTGIKEYLKTFITHRIVNSEYPHDEIK
ncbi:MAG TPA: hypothetical protein VFC65_17830 [Prolixibacteraceae bacterium]|nr:hypothetical protein [Prolixibacteraceae bacterium]